VHGRCGDDGAGAAPISRAESGEREEVDALSIGNIKGDKSHAWSAVSTSVPRRATDPPPPALTDPAHPSTKLLGVHWATFANRIQIDGSSQ